MTVIYWSLLYTLFKNSRYTKNYMSKMSFLIDVFEKIVQTIGHF